MSARFSDESGGMSSTPPTPSADACRAVASVGTPYTATITSCATRVRSGHRSMHARSRGRWLLVAVVVVARAVVIRVVCDGNVDEATPDVFVGVEVAALLHDASAARTMQSTGTQTCFVFAPRRPIVIGGGT